MRLSPTRVLRAHARALEAAFPVQPSLYLGDAPFARLQRGRTRVHRVVSAGEKSAPAHIEAVKLVSEAFARRSL